MYQEIEDFLIECYNERLLKYLERDDNTKQDVVLNKYFLFYDGVSISIGSSFDGHKIIYVRLSDLILFNKNKSDVPGYGSRFYEPLTGSIFSEAIEEYSKGNYEVCNNILRSLNYPFACYLSIAASPTIKVKKVIKIFDSKEETDDFMTKLMYYMKDIYKKVSIESRGSFVYNEVNGYYKVFSHDIEIHPTTNKNLGYMIELSRELGLFGTNIRIVMPSKTYSFQLPFYLFTIFKNELQ